MAIDLVEGQTVPIKYTLNADGAAENLTGLTVALVAYDKKGRVLSLSGSVSVLSAVNGQVAFNPDPADLVAANSPMYVRWKLTDVDDKVAFYPSGAPEQWIVQRP